MNPKAFVVPGAAKETRVRRVRKMRRGESYAQLEKSSISLFKIIPSEVMTVEPQYRLIAVCELSAFYTDSSTNDPLVVSETTLPHLSAAAKWEVP